MDAQARELQTTLHIASRLGNTDIVMILLSANANPNAATKDLYTPLHIAAKVHSFLLIGFMIRLVAYKSEIRFPIVLVEKMKNVEIASALLAFRVDNDDNEIILLDSLPLPLY